MKTLKKNLKNRKGFTLIELIVVVAILAILAAVAIPRFTGMAQRSEVTARTAMATTIVNSAEVAFVEMPVSSTATIKVIGDITIPNLITAGYLREFTNTDPVYTLAAVGTEGKFKVTVPHPSGTGTITVGAAH